MAEQLKSVTINTMLQGKVLFFDRRVNNYGFIKTENNEKLFFHQEDLKGDTPEAGDTVTFKITTDKKKPGKYKAIAVKVIERGRDNK